MRKNAVCSEARWAGKQLAIKQAQPDTSSELIKEAWNLNKTFLTSKLSINIYIYTYLSETLFEFWEPLSLILNVNVEATLDSAFIFNWNLPTGIPNPAK
jgi:hypothetical protein